MESFEITPPILIPWLTEDEKEKNILLLNLQIDAIKEDLIRLDLDIVFNPLSFRRGVVTRKDFYIGCSGAEIKIIFPNGNVTEYSKSKTLTVNYANSIDHQRASSTSLKPSLKFKDSASKSELNVSLGELVHKNSTVNNYSVSFQNEERELAVITMDNSIKWFLSLPRGEKAIRDFIVGNLHLYSIFSTNKEEDYGGKVIIKPNDITFYDNDRRPLGFKENLMMRYKLYKAGMDILNADGFTVSFKRICEIFNASDYG